MRELFFKKEKKEAYWHPLRNVAPIERQPFRSLAVHIYPLRQAHYA